MLQTYFNIIFLQFSFIFSYFSALDYEIVIVEDSSPDGTLQVAEEMKKIYDKDRIIILSRPGKMGLGSAYMVSHHRHHLFLTFPPDF